jgi:hypothetical protein
LELKKASQRRLNGCLLVSTSFPVRMSDLREEIFVISSGNSTRELKLKSNVTNSFSKLNAWNIVRMF